MFIDLWAGPFTFDDNAQVNEHWTPFIKCFMHNKILIFQQETGPGFTNTVRIKEKVLKVLKQIHGEKGEEVVRVDMYCHFGHAYINKVDEGRTLTS